MRERIRGLFSNLGGKRQGMQDNIPPIPPDDSDDTETDSFSPPIPTGVRNETGGGLVKIAVISFIVAFLAMAVTSFLGGGFFVTKKDFTANMASVTTTLDQAKTDLALSNQQVTSAVQGIPGTVTTHVNNAVSQATSQWTGQLSSLSDKVTSLASGSQSNSNNIASLTNEIEKSRGDITDLKNKVSGLEASIAEVTTSINTIKSDVAVLKNQIDTDSSVVNTGDVTIVTTPFQSIPVYQNIQYLYSLQITNTTNTLKRVYIQALLTPSSELPGQTTANVITANFSVTGGSMTANTFTSSYSPSQTNCLMVLATSNGYIQALGTGTTTVIVTLDYAANPAFMWNIEFKPIVTSY